MEQKPRIYKFKQNHSNPWIFKQCKWVGGIGLAENVSNYSQDPKKFCRRYVFWQTCLPIEGLAFFYCEPAICLRFRDNNVFI